MKQPNPNSPKLTDPVALARNRRRARLDHAGFLHAIALDEMAERLNDINRVFEHAAIITPFAEFWAGLLPNAAIFAPADYLNLPDGQFDLIIHAMDLHWADDPLGQIVQCRRGLKPDGVFMAVCFGGDTLIELRQVLAQAESQVLGGLSPRILPMAELRDFGGLIGRAGLALPVADVVRQSVRYESVFALMRDLRDMGERNALAARHIAAVPRRFFEHADALYRASTSSANGQGDILATFDLIFLAGWAPHDSQPKPLRPGSAKTSLIDALRPVANITKD